MKNGSEFLLKWIISVVHFACMPLLEFMNNHSSILVPCGSMVSAMTHAFPWPPIHNLKLESLRSHRVVSQDLSSLLSFHSVFILSDFLIRKWWLQNFLVMIFSGLLLKLVLISSLSNKQSKNLSKILILFNACFSVSLWFTMVLIPSSWTQYTFVWFSLLKEPINVFVVRGAV